MSSPFQVVVLISGTGTNLQRLIDTVLDALATGVVVDVPGRHAVIVRGAAHAVVIYRSGVVVRIRQSARKVTLQ